jgi:hypothetical protein
VWSCNIGHLSRVRSAGRARSKGQSLLLFALALVVVLSFVGLALDGGLALSKRRAMQNAADAAAFAGAREVALGHDQPSVYTTVYSYSQGYNGAASFTGTYYPGNETLGSGSGSPPSGSTGVCVTTHITHQTLFMGLIGINSVPISAQACAVAEGACPRYGYAVWAEHDYDHSQCDPCIDWAGSDANITGDVHSNGNIKMAGKNNHVNGRTEWVTPGCVGCTANGNDINATQVPAPSSTPPVYYNIADYQPRVPNPFPTPGYQPGGVQAEKAYALGQYFDLSDPQFACHFPTDPADGLYWGGGCGSLNISNMTTSTPKHLTLVVPDPVDINFNVSGVSVLPYTDDGLLLFGNLQPTAAHECDVAAISMSGSNNSWGGIMYAPNAQIVIAGSGNTTYSGSIVAQAVKITGSGLNLSYSDQFCPASGRPLSAHLTDPNASPAPTSTTTGTATSTATNTATNTATSTATNTPTSAPPTNTATRTLTGTATRTATSAPPTNTATRTPTNTPTSTATGTPPTSTPTGTSTLTPTRTPTGTWTPTPTRTYTSTSTATPVNCPFTSTVSAVRDTSGGSFNKWAQAQAQIRDVNNQPVTGLTVIANVNGTNITLQEVSPGNYSGCTGFAVGLGPTVSFSYSGAACTITQSPANPITAPNGIIGSCP